LGFELTGKGIILILGGIFLIYKSTTEIHHKITGDDDEFNADKSEVKSAFVSVLFQIALLNLVFSFDSILTAIGIVKEIPSNDFSSHIIYVGDDEIYRSC
jgi:predicted tellurium resistance membrane protein TerC